MSRVVALLALLVAGTMASGGFPGMGGLTMGGGVGGGGGYPYSMYDSRYEVVPYPCPSPMRLVCKASFPWKGIKGMDWWCNLNCPEGRCNDSRCVCSCAKVKY
ncbi:hypothetical protein ScPMuIL_003346 [Solemya velum]